MARLSRRLFVALCASAVVASPARAQAAVFRYNDGCGCFQKWAGQMAEAGMPVVFEASGDLLADHAALGIAADLAGCHVGRIGGYVISGHVPPADILRLIKDKPEGLALTVPGMPMGSPGMEYQGQVDPYAVLLLKADGTTTEYARYG